MMSLEQLLQPQFSNHRGSWRTHRYLVHQTPVHFCQAIVMLLRFGNEISDVCHFRATK